MVKMRLLLEDGTVFEGSGFGFDGPVAGEVVFNTGMMGYPEALSDPSYTGQILAMTYPHVGNYGVPEMVTDELGLPRGFESNRATVAGLVVASYSEHYSHHSAQQSLGRWLNEHRVPAITGVDTRALTRRLRESGTMLGKLETRTDEIPFDDPNARNLVRGVSVPERVGLAAGAPSEGTGGRRPRVVLVDCGCKTSIVRSLMVRDVDVIRVPFDDYFLDLDYDGLLLSNGPGDPRMCKETVQNVAHALAVGKPILGICLGHQLLALAAGAETYKLKFGHRGQNQPCLDVTEEGGGRALVTSQNHGFAVRRDSLPQGWQVWFENVNDGTVEGIRHVTKPFKSVQFHPEASPGPRDAEGIFDEFVATVKRGMR